MKTLLQKAQAIKQRKYVKGLNNHVSEQEIEMAFAWLRGEVSSTQIAKIMYGRQSGSALYRLSLILREAFFQKRIKIK